VAVQEGGMPIPRGGGAKLVDALVRLIGDHGGVAETGKDVERVLVQAGRAVGVRTTEGETVTATDAVICCVTPTQLYQRLLADAGVPPEVAEGARRFRHGRSEMQIHFALSEPARWDGDERLNRTAIVHLTPGLDGVSRAVNEAERGLLPVEATVVVGQALTIDQNFLWRPFPRNPGHATPVEQLYQIGASTWPGPGLGAGSGVIVAEELLRPPPAERAMAKVRSLLGREHA